MKHVAPVLLGAMLAACTLTTDLDGFVRPTTAAPVAPEAGADGGAPSQDGGVPSTCNADVDLAADPKNCGRCGHDCLGGRCETGTCKPHRIAVGFDEPIGLALAGGFLWVGHAAGLDRLSLDGAEQKRIASTPRVSFVTATGTDVFWASTGGNAIRRVPITGGESKVIRGSLENLLGIAVSPQWIFLSRPDQKLLQRFPFTTETSTVDPETIGDLDFHGVEWVGGSLFATAYEAGVVVEIPADGKGARREIMRGGGPFGVKVDGDDVFVTRGEASDLVRVPKSGGKPSVLAADLDGPGGLVVTPTAIYLTEVDGGRVLVLAR